MDRVQRHPLGHLLVDVGHVGGGLDVAIVGHHVGVVLEVRDVGVRAHHVGLAQGERRSMLVVDVVLDRVEPVRRALPGLRCLEIDVVIEHLAGLESQRHG